MISCKNKFRRQFDFILQGQALEIVDTYSYLGVILVQWHYNGTANFNQNLKMKTKAI